MVESEKEQEVEIMRLNEKSINIAIVPTSTPTFLHKTVVARCLVPGEGRWGQ